MLELVINKDSRYILHVCVSFSINKSQKSKISAVSSLSEKMLLIMKSCTFYDSDNI